MRALLLSSAITFVPCLALADPQCTLPPSSASAASVVPQATTAVLPVASQAAASAVVPVLTLARTPPAGTGSPALDHVAEAGAQLTEVGTSRGLRTVIARSDGQFMRMYVAPDGQALVAGLMAELSVAELLAMAPDQATELGNMHGLRGIFIRNGGQFQVFYATPDEEHVIPGAMFDAQGKNLTRDQVASIPGAIPTVVIGDAPVGSAAATQAPTGSLLKAVEGTTYGTIGLPAAPRLWVFVDPLCGWSVRAMEQLRPSVASGRVQLAVVPVSVLDREPHGRSRLAARRC